MYWQYIIADFSSTLDFWRLLAIIDNIWQLLAIIADFWRLLAIIGLKFSEIYLNLRITFTKNQEQKYKENMSYNFI